MPLVRIRITVAGFTEAEVRAGIADLLDEFRERSWIIQPAATWDSERDRLVVTTHYEGDDAESSTQRASDEVWDCVIACIHFSSDGIQFGVDDVAVVQTA